MSHWVTLKNGESWTDANLPEEDDRLIEYKITNGFVTGLCVAKELPQVLNLEKWRYAENVTNKVHNHYKKDVSKLAMIDVYRVLELWKVDDHAIGHAIKKLLNAGQRGAKDKSQDVKEAIDSLVRWQAMRKEDETKTD